jgi:two-component system, OmpR family, copper resistance phosphate regulon response regulator CusR
MKILLVEDEQRVSAFIRKGLEEASYHVTLAYDGEYGSKLAIQHSYDLIILDIILPGKSGLDVGADDCLIKPFHFKELLARVKALTRRRGKITNKTVYRVGGFEMNTEAKKVTRGGKQIKLTAKEFRLLEVLLQNRGRVLARTEIAQYSWASSLLLLTRKGCNRLWWKKSPFVTMKSILY